MPLPAVGLFAVLATAASAAQQVKSLVDSFLLKANLNKPDLIIFSTGCGPSGRI